MRSTILINVKTSTVNSKRNLYIAEWGLMGSEVCTFVCLCAENEKNLTTGIRDFSV